MADALRPRAHCSTADSGVNSGDEGDVEIKSDLSDPAASSRKVYCVARGESCGGCASCRIRRKLTAYQAQASLPTLWARNITSIEDAIFSIFSNDEQLVPMGRFLKAIGNAGVRKNDPRLREMLEQLERHERSNRTGSSVLEPVDGLTLNRQQFCECIGHNIVLINRILRNKVIIPDWPDFCEQLEEMYLTCKTNTTGKVATYIPQLARMDPACWGVAVCTVDGQRVSFGDAKKPMCLQSVSKMFNYALAHRDLGADTVHQLVGQEPSGRIFNELALDYNNRPHNPMVNAGAIVVCSLLQKEAKMADRFDYVMDFYKRMAGREHIGFNNAVFLSERDTADRNYALAYYMREHNCFPPGTASLQETLDFYFQLCSVEITCEVGAVMAATFANGGICPITDENILSASTVRDVLSLMYSCGMYDYSGQFAFKIGLPAKSGVSGLILVVVPNVMGIALWSPLLDRWGNSCRGVQFCSDFVSRFNFHNYDSMKRTHKKMDPRRHKTETKGQQVVSLLFSAANGDVTALRRYYLQGFNLNMADYDGRTALHLAAAEGHEDCVKFLLEKGGVSPFLKDRWGHTAVDDARMYKHESIVKLVEGWQARAKAARSSEGDKGVNAATIDVGAAAQTDENGYGRNYDGV